MDLSTSLFITVWLTSAVAVDQSSLCNDISSLNCLTYIPADKDERVCARTSANKIIRFNNFCEFSKAKCRDDNLAIVDFGNCLPPSSPKTTVTHSSTTRDSTTVSSTAISTTSPPITSPSIGLSVFCSNKDRIVCPTTIDLVCGSDRKFYLNNCEFAKKHCADPSLTSDIIDHCRV